MQVFPTLCTCWSDGDEKQHRVPIKKYPDANPLALLFRKILHFYNFVSVLLEVK